MAAPVLVNVICDLTDGGNNPITSGWAYFYPSAHLISPTFGPALVTQNPLPVDFAPSGNPVIGLIANDNAGITPPGWSWQVIYQGGGMPAPQTLSALNAAVQTFTATNGTPCIFTGSGAGYVNGTQVQLTGASLPAGFLAGTTYYVVNAAGSAFQLAATPGGAPIASTSTGSGTVQVSAVYLSSLVS